MACNHPIVSTSSRVISIWTESDILFVTSRSAFSKGGDMGHKSLARFKCNWHTLNLLRCTNIGPVSYVTYFFFNFFFGGDGDLNMHSVPSRCATTSMTSIHVVFLGVFIFTFCYIKCTRLSLLMFSFYS